MAGGRGCQWFLVTWVPCCGRAWAVAVARWRWRPAEAEAERRAVRYSQPDTVQPAGSTTSLSSTQKSPTGAACSAARRGGAPILQAWAVGNH
eukprot:COSAG01_NODE_1780_length_9247_cov_8.464145_4_plen_92_part_00